jgi:hypothetical protein
MQLVSTMALFIASASVSCNKTFGRVDSEIVLNEMTGLDLPM